jgi:putative hemolysin
MRMIALALPFILAGALAACDDTEDEAESDSVGLANPAAVFCTEQGGASEIRTADDGSQFGVCILPDGQEVDEWDYYREHHPEENGDG